MLKEVDSKQESAFFLSPALQSPAGTLFGQSERGTQLRSGSMA